LWGGGGGGARRRLAGEEEAQSLVAARPPSCSAALRSPRSEACPTRARRMKTMLDPYPVLVKLDIFWLSKKDGMTYNLGCRSTH
jgi:hypothetical protein